jgi:hypothetical protein
MNTKTNKKLCWNCEGNVEKEAVQCHYCGVTLKPSYEDDEDETPASMSSNNKIASERSSRISADENLDNSDWSNAGNSEKTAESHIISIPFALLLSGIVLFLFSFMLLFFSKDGVLILKWNSQYWFIYLMVALPLLLFGWKLLKSSEEQQ